jgi:hypothetical protein
MERKKSAPDRFTPDRTREKLVWETISPSLFIIYASAMAYISTALFKMAYNIFIPLAHPKKKKIQNKYWRINISSVSAIIMIAAVFFMMLLSGNPSPVPAAVMANLALILSPGFFITGIYALDDRIFKNAPKALKAILAVSAVVLLERVAYFAPHAVIIIIIATGVYASLIGDLRKFRDKLRKIIFGDDDEEDEDDDFYY